MGRCSTPTLPLSTQTTFSYRHPRTWGVPRLDLIVFLLHLLNDSAGQCYTFADHLVGSYTVGYHVLLSSHLISYRSGPFHNLRVLNARYLLVSCTWNWFGSLCGSDVSHTHLHRNGIYCSLGNGFWPLCSYLCTPPLYNHPDTLSASGPWCVYYNASSPAHVAHSLTHRLPFHGLELLPTLIVNTWILPS